MWSSTSSQSVTTSGRLIARLPRGGELRGFEPERLARGDEVGLVRAEEFEHRPLGLARPMPGAQAFGREPGRSRKRRARRSSAEHPGERPQGTRMRPGR